MDINLDSLFFSTKGRERLDVVSSGRRTRRKGAEEGRKIRAHGVGRDAGT